ncbi:hypothetical protein C3L33_10487, partial [Rhododendron williamsianum]
MGTVKVQVPQGGWDEHLDELSTGITKPTNPNNVMQVLRGFSIPLTLKPTTRGFICLALNLGCLGRSWCLRRTRKYARTKNCLAVAREVRPSEDTSKWRWVRSVESLLERGRRLTTPSLLGDFFLAYLGSRPWHLDAHFPLSVMPETIFYFIGFAFFCLESLISIWVIQQVYMYFRGSGKETEMKRDVARRTMMAAM